MFLCILYYITFILYTLHLYIIHYIYIVSFDLPAEAPRIPPGARQIKNNDDNDNNNNNNNNSKNGNNGNNTANHSNSNNGTNNKCAVSQWTV